MTREMALRRAVALVEAGVLAVDERGRVWRRWRILASGEARAIRRRRAENVGGGGYLRITWREGSRIVQVMAHRLVFAVSTGTIPPDDLQINHKDLNRQNNRPANLELVTQSENIRHRIEARALRIAA